MGKNSLEDKPLRIFDAICAEYKNWFPIFNRLGLKPRRYFKDDQGVYVATAEGWFRLSMVPYEKGELQWIRSILLYLEERSFANWAVSWQKTIIWEENDSCFLIQPWEFTGESFSPGDPAAIGRVAEILAELYRCGKDYRENKGIEIYRDRWSTIEHEWEGEMKRIQELPEDLFHEKVRKEIHGCKKEIGDLLTDCLAIWKSGINNLFDHHLRSGVIGHGNLTAAKIIWKDKDFYLLDWEHLSFQPKIADLAALINDVGIWEPEWIVYLINEYSRLQPFWPEEYEALKAMLQYPKRIVQLLREENAETLEYKEIKEARKELKRKERCLAKVWRDLGTEKRWAKSRVSSDKISDDRGKISMVLSPMETWGGFTARQFDSLIHVKSEQRLPKDVLERLTNISEDRVFGGRDGNIMEGASGVEQLGLSAELGGFEIIENVQPPTEETVELDEAQAEELTEAKEKDSPVEKVDNSPAEDLEKNEPAPVLKPQNQLLSWSKFPTPIKK
ncbi:MAG TPA: phosphotransferase [Bacillota bacterium]|nr:phosphotransferase [Bacillota bacterium]